MKKLIKYVSLATGIALFTIVVVSEVHAAELLIKKEQQQLAALSTQLEHIKNLFQRFTRTFFRSASAQSTGWNFVGGTTASGPGAVVNGSTLHLFVRGNDNFVYENTRPVGGTTAFSGWGKVLPEGLTDGKPSAVAVNNDIYLFVKGLNNQIYMNRKTAGGWSGFTDIGGITTHGPEAIWDGGRIRLFVRAGDSLIYQRSYNVSSNTWTNWSSVGGFTRDSLASALAGNTLYLFAKGDAADNNLYVNTASNIGSDVLIWSGWLSLGGIIKGSPAAAMDANGKIHVFVQGQDDRIYSKSKDQIGAWSADWVEVPGNGFTSSGPEAISEGGQIKLFVRGVNNVIYVHENPLSGISQCTFTISSSNISLSKDAASRSFNVTTGSNCSWAAQSGVGWISITSPLSNTGNGTVNYSVSANTGPSSRTGTITAGGQIFTITQQAAGSAGSSITSITSPAASTRWQVGTYQTITWTPAVQNPGGIYLVTASDGTFKDTICSGANCGTGSVGWNIPAAIPPGSYKIRTATDSSGTQYVSSAEFILSSAGTGNQCILTLFSHSATHSSSDSSGSFNLTTNSGCAWTAQSSASWISIISGSNGTGNGTVSYSVAENTSTDSRTGTITVASGSLVQTFTITQAGTGGGGQCTEDQINQIITLVAQATQLVTQCIAGSSAACTQAIQKLSEAGAIITVCRGGGGGGGQVQLFMDPDGPGSMPRETGVVTSKLFLEIPPELTSARQPTAVGTTPGIVTFVPVGEFLADIQWEAPANTTCTLSETVPRDPQLLIQQGGSVVPIRIALEPNTFTFPNLPSNGNAKFPIPTNAHWQRRGWGGVGDADPINVSFSMTCGGQTSNTITATFLRSDVLKTKTQLESAQYTIMRPDQITGSVKVDVRAANRVSLDGPSQIDAYDFTGAGEVGPFNCKSGVGQPQICSYALFWSAMNAVTCDIDHIPGDSQSGTLHAYTAGLDTTQFVEGYHTSPVFRRNGAYARFVPDDVAVTCKNLSGQTASDSVRLLGQQQ
jgi:hypothetical protein